MKRYYIQFNEHIDGKWQHITTEDYDDLPLAKGRFFAAVDASKHSANSVSFTLVDRVRVQYQMDNEEIMDFSYIVD